MLKKNDVILMGLLTAAYAWITSLWAGLIPFHDGLGTDGRIYAALAMDFWGQVFERGVWEYSPDYYLQRSLPSLVVYLGHKAFTFGAAATTESTILGFRLLNIACLWAGVASWAWLTRSLQIGRGWAWAGFVLIFSSVCNFYVPFYYPTLTDTATFAISFWLIAAFVAERPNQVLAAALAGAFVWPILFPLGGILYIFPRKNLPEKNEDTPTWARLAIAILAATAILAGVVLVALTPYSEKYGLARMGLSLHMPWTWMAGALLGLYIGLMAWHASGFKAIFELRRLLASISIPKILLVAGLFLGCKLLVFQITGKTTSSNVIAMILVTNATLADPFVFPIRHALYFGGLIPLFYVFFRSCLAEARSMGVGFWIYMSIHLMLSYDKESRHLGIVFPLVAALTILACQKAIRLDRITVAAIGIFALGYNLLWLWSRQFPTPDSDVFHLYMWGHPDWLSWAFFGASILVAFFLKKRGQGATRL